MRRISPDIALPLSLAALGMLVYLPALANYPVADTWVFLVHHSFRETLRFFATSMIPPEWQALWLRPIPMLLFWMDTVVWPNPLVGAHLTNILLNTVNILLIWRIVRFAAERSSRHNAVIDYRFPGTVACLIYALHPLNVGAIGWSAARFDVMGVLFGLAAIDRWLRWDAGSRPGIRGWLWMLFLVLALLSKEQSIIYFVMLFLLSGYRLIRRAPDSRRHVAAMVGSAVIVVAYAVYRFSVFHGLGGYLQSTGGMNFAVPVYYFIAVLVPWLYPLPGWALRWTVPLTVAAAGYILFTVTRRPQRSYGVVEPFYLAAAALIAIFSLATNAPSGGMTLPMILHHAEARFALGTVAGIALLAGMIAPYAACSARKLHYAALMLAIWCVFSVWRTDVQLQAWRAAGETARQIVSLAPTEVPDPPVGSTLLFLNIPRETPQYAYIFGIGLKEAVQRSYPGRDDLRIIARGTNDDLRAVNPDRDYVFAFNAGAGILERLYPTARPDP